jgi:hypothetical protein
MYKFNWKIIPIVVVFLILAYGLSIILVALSAFIGPIVFQYMGYKVTAPFQLTASEATSYTLQSFLAVVVGFIIIFMNLSKNDWYIS